MDIKIQNYNSIKELNYSIEDGKINFLFGISGCGKSSIAYALTNQDFTRHIPYGTENEPNVEIDNHPVEYENIKMFDLEYMNDILIQKNKEHDVYNILIGDGGNIVSLKEDYNKAIQELWDQRSFIYETEGKISTLQKDLKISYLKDGTHYRSTCLIGKMTKNLDTKEGKSARKKGLTSNRIKWLSDGTKTEEYADDKCPFCNRKITDKKKEQIEGYIIFDAKTYEKVNSKSDIFKDLKIDEPDWLKKKEVERFNKQIKDNYQLLPEFQAIMNYINLAKSIDISVDSFKPLKVSREMEQYYSDLSAAIKRFNDNYALIRKKISNIKSNTDKLIKGNLRIINDYLSLLGIQYQFCRNEIDAAARKATFIIKSNLDKQDLDRAENLSFGEKNIIGMLLFLLSNKESDFLIIDDPASSYDEYRRKVIFDILYQLKSEKTTMLVLSHDHVFAKYALYHYEVAAQRKRIISNKDKLYLAYTGNVDYIESYSKTNITKIKSTDFNSISVFVKERINSLGNCMDYQMAINLRLYLEINKSVRYYRTVYGYLSAIIHKRSKAEIIEQLKNQGRTEEDIIAVLRDEFKKDFGFLDEHYCSGINISQFSDFEKLIFAREECKNNKREKVIKDELSNVVHMNLAYAVCLDPYKFNYFSKYVDEYLSKELNII